MKKTLPLSRLDDGQFRRLTGVRRETFREMLRILTQGRPQAEEGEGWAPEQAGRARDAPADAGVPAGVPDPVPHARVARTRRATEARRGLRAPPYELRPFRA